MDEELKNTLLDMVADLLFYDRKEDDLLPIGAIEEMVDFGKVSVEDMVYLFETELRICLHRHIEYNKNRIK